MIDECCTHLKVAACCLMNLSQENELVLEGFPEEIRQKLSLESEFKSWCMLNLPITFFLFLGLAGFTQSKNVILTAPPDGKLYSTGRV